jgi:EAL domain-containing protein (putative c-di-GMP-specific phosphodiesterase class I)
VVRLGQSLLQLVTAAEGMEDHAQFLALRRMGCDIGQGSTSAGRWKATSWRVCSATSWTPPRQP